MNSTTVTPIDAIDHAAKDYADARAVLAERVNRYKSEVEAITRRLTPGIRLAAGKAAMLESELRTLITENKDLFVRPKTWTRHGVKLGLQKGKGKTEWPDDDTLGKLMHRHLGKEAVLYIQVVETPNKTMLQTLDADTLKKLGYRVTGTEDQVVIKDAIADIDKLVATLLAKTAENAAEEAGA